MLSGDAIAWALPVTLPISQFLWQYTQIWAQVLYGLRMAIIGYRRVTRSTGEVCPSFMKSRSSGPCTLGLRTVCT